MTRSPAGSNAPLRVAFVSDAVHPFHRGGKESRLDEITRRLAATGVDVDVYTMKWWDGADHIDIDGVGFHALGPYRALYDGERRSMRQAIGFGVNALRLMRHSFDVVDVDHMPFFPLFTVRLVAALKRRPMVATWHEVWGASYWRRYLGGIGGIVAAVIERLSFTLPRVVVANSDQTASRLAAAGCRRPIEVMMPGVDLDLVDAVTVDELDHDGPVDVLFAGRLLGHKNAEVLVHAAAILAERGVVAHTLIVGEGPERERVRDAITARNIGDRVTVTTFFPHRRTIFAAMKAARVVVLPSEREGFGMVVVEAHGCGTPVITVDVPDNAARTLVSHGRNGLVVDLSPVGLADAIESILSGAAPLDTAPAIRASAAPYDWDHIVGRLRELYGSVAGRTIKPADAASEKEVPQWTSA
ncbi:MAG: glycosyltransferase family 4 protein [Acidimicrobiia bacterium]